jgi:hypothetical protein
MKMDDWNIALCFIVATVFFVSCFPSMGPAGKDLRHYTLTGRYLDVFYKADNSGNLIPKQLSSTDLKYLQKDLTFLTVRISAKEDLNRKFIKHYTKPSFKVHITNDELPNMSTDCDNLTINIYSGLVNSMFRKTITLLFQDSTFKKQLFSSDFWDNKFFNNGDSNDSVQIFLKLLYSYKFKKETVFKLLKDFDNDDDFNDMEKYQFLSSHVIFIDNELTKILTFLVSHEFYHLSSKCDISRESEAAADAFGILQYVNLVPQDVASSNYMQEIFSNLTLEYRGRPIQEIFLDLYSGSSFNELNSIYIPYPERIQRIDSLLASDGINLQSTGN